MIATNAVKNAINSLQAANMPIGYLKSVVNNYSITQGSKNKTDTALNIVYFDANTISGLNKLLPTSIHPASSAVGSLYHEFTHAYFDLNSNDPAIKQLFKTAIPYYTGVTLKEEVSQRTKKCSDPKDVVGEAAANYIDHLTNSYWDAYSLISKLYWVVLPRKRSADHLAHCAKY